MFNWFFLLIFYLPFQIALNPGGGFDLSSLRIFIVLFFLFWLVIKKPRFVFNLQSIGLLLFLFLIGLSLIKADNVFLGIRKMVYFLSIFPLYFITFSLVDNFRKSKKIIQGLVISAGVFALIGLIQFLSQFVFGLERVYYFWANNILPVFSGFNLGTLILAYPSWLVNIKGETIMRVFSLFSDPHMLSFYLGLILPLIIFYSVKNKKYLYLYFVIFLALCLSFTRGAYLAIIISLLVLSFLFWRYLAHKKMALVLLASLLIFIIPISPISDRFYSSFDLNEGSNLGRLEMWQEAKSLGFENIWQGIGLGNYYLSIDPDFGYRNPITAHNLYLDIFSETGLFTLMVLLFLIFGTIWQMFKKIKKFDFNREKKILLAGLISSLVYFSVHSFFETAIYHPSVLALFMIVLGLSTALIRDEN